MADEPAEAIRRLEEKIQNVTHEYVDGKINQAQFQAIYSRYFSQKVAIARILAANPQSESWQKAAASGATGYLREANAAYPLGIMLVDIRDGGMLESFGRFDLKSDLLLPLLTSLTADSDAASEIGVSPADKSGVKSTAIEGGRWITLAPGQYSASLVLFSREPSSDQIRDMIALHRLFETANRTAFEAGSPSPAQLVYPQKALFEES